ncbi:MAG: hypothetical protein ACRERC_17360 [Candidatus Binatia bacterium]
MEWRQVRRWAQPLAACGLALWVAQVTWTRGHQAQFDDYIAVQTHNEIRAWVAGTHVPQGPAEFWPPTESRCGIFHWTHHPLLNSYLAVLALKAGASSPAVVPVGGAALVTGILVGVLAWRRVTTALPLALLLVAACWWAPGYGAWLAFPIEHSWAMTCAFALVLAAVCVRRAWAVALTAGITACFSTDLVFIHAAVVAGACIAAYGVTWHTVRVGAWAIAAYSVAFALHIVQVACHWQWDWAYTWADMFTGLPGSTSVFTRVGAGGLHERVALAAQWLPDYSRAVLTDARWAEQWFWWAAMAALLCSRPSARGLTATAVFVVGVAAWFFLVPGLIMHHLHYLPRYLLLVPLIACALCAAAERRATWE